MVQKVVQCTVSGFLTTAEGLDVEQVFANPVPSLFEEVFHTLDERCGLCYFLAATAIDCIVHHTLRLFLHTLCTTLAAETCKHLTHLALFRQIGIVGVVVQLLVHLRQVLTAEQVHKVVVEFAVILLYGFYPQVRVLVHRCVRVEAVFGQVDMITLRQTKESATRFHRFAFRIFYIHQSLNLIKYSIFKWL